MQKIDLKNQSVYKLYFRYFLPSLCAMLALSTYNVVDGIFVGQKLGEDALAAVGIAWPVFPVLIAYELLFSIGAASISSYYLGRGQEQKAREVFSSVFYFAFLSGVVLGLLFYVFCDEIVIALGANEEIAPLSKEFLQVIFLGAFIIVLHPLLDIFAINDKRPTLAMIAMIVGACSNVLLNYLFIFIFEWGLFGSAMATVLGHSIGFLILLSHFIRARGQIYFVWALRLKILLKAAQNGIAQASAELSASAVMLVANHLLIGLGGKKAVAMYSVVMYSGIVLFTTLLSASQAIQPIASYNFGTRAFKRLVSILRFALIFSLSLGLVLYLLAMYFSDYLVILFLQKDANNLIDTSFLNDTIKVMSIYFLGYILIGFNMSVASFFQSIQRPMSSFIVTISYTLIFVLLFFMILPEFWGINGIWASYPLGQLISFGIALLVLWYEFNKGILSRTKWSAFQKQKSFM